MSWLFSYFWFGWINPQNVKKKDNLWELAEGHGNWQSRSLLCATVPSVFGPLGARKTINWNYESQQLHFWRATFYNGILSPALKNSRCTTWFDAAFQVLPALVLRARCVSPKSAEESARYLQEPGGAMQVGHGCFHIHHHVEMAGFILIGLIGETMQEQFKSPSDGPFHLHRLGQSNLHGCFDHDDRWEQNCSKRTFHHHF